MKFLRRFLIVALLIGYVLWPYQAVKSFARALDKKDSAALDRMVEFDALRESLEGIAVEIAVIEAENRLPANNRMTRDELRNHAKAMMNSAAAERHFNSALNGDALLQMLTVSSGNLGQVRTGWRNEKWINPVTFSVQDLSGKTRVIFKFTGFGWKMTSIEIPPDEMRVMWKVIKAGSGHN